MFRKTVFGRFPLKAYAGTVLHSSNNCQGFEIIVVEDNPRPEAMERDKIDRLEGPS